MSARRALALLLVCLLFTSSCAGGRPVVVGSKMFPESRLLAEMLVVLLQDRGIAVSTRANLGGTLVAFDALRTGAIDVYPEYTGTGLEEILKLPGGRDPRVVFETVKARFAAQYALAWLDPLGFNNTYALAMRADDAKRRHLRTISDLAAVAGGLVFGCSHEFYERKDGYPGLAASYGLRFRDVPRLQHGLAYQALLQGKIDLTDVYSTDGNLDPASIQVLADDRHYFPPYFAAPLVRQDALQRVPGLREALNGLAGRIDDTQMQRLNHAVEAEKRDFREVAVEFLRSRGLTRATAEREDTGGGVWGLMWRRRAEIGHLVAQHLSLTGTALALAVLVGIPLGIGITRWLSAAGPVLGATGILQTIPSIALLAFMIPYLGLGAKPAVAALFLYALLPIVRNTYTGVRSVDPSLIEVGTGMGLTRRQILTLVELPLAAPFIMAGIRTAAVISIGTATLAAFIGAGGLGDPIVTGLARYDVPTVLTGAIPAAVLAVLVDLLLGLVERRVTPKN